MPGDRPAAAWYNVNPFLSQDFASVAQSTDAIGNDFHYLGFDRDGATSTERMSDACLETFLAAARVPRAPVFIHMLTMLDARSRGAAGSGGRDRRVRASGFAGGTPSHPGVVAEPVGPCQCAA